MIKQAEIQNAYLLGRQAAMEKLAIAGADTEVPVISDPYGSGLVSSMGPNAPTEEEARQSFFAKMVAGEAKAREDAAAPEMQARMEAAINTAKGPMNHDQDFVVTPGLPTPSGLDFNSELGRQAAIADLIGLGGSGLRRSDIESDPLLANKINYLPQSGLDPMNFATMQNLSRAGMLGGAIGGTAIGGSPLAALTSTAGALGGGMIGGNLGRALGAGLAAYNEEGGGLMNARTQNLVAGGGALGGLGGGLAAGYLT
jgi:hypothetical protein